MKRAVSVPMSELEEIAFNSGATIYRTGNTATLTLADGRRYKATLTPALPDTSHAAQVGAGR